MNSRRDGILRVLSSIAVGIMAFCLLFPAAMIIGALLFDLPEGAAFFSSQEVILFFTSFFIGLITAISAGTKYHRFLKEKNDYVRD